MRLKIKLTGTDKILPINNQHIVNSFFHKLLGKNNKWHDTISDYCVSSLRGGKHIGDKNISFKNGGYIIISSEDTELLTTILSGLMENSIFHDDIKVNGFEYLPEENYFNGWNHFRTLTPILLKVDGKDITIEDDDYVKALTEQTKTKLSNYDPKLFLDNIEIKIKSHPAHRVKNVYLMKKNGVAKNHATECQLSIFCSKEVAKALYNIGFGKSTGAGFGMVYKTENKHLYY